MKKIVISCLMIFCLTIISAQADDNVTKLEEVVVTGEKLITPTKQTGETVYTGSEITKKGMEIQGAQGAVSIYEAIDMLPGINVESSDPYGLSAEQRSVRVRGVRGFLGSMTVEGVPNWGGNPMGPREYVYDAENFQSIAVYKGAVPADFGTGVGARGGAIELKPRWPEEKFGADLSQSFGEDNYSRTFLRLDTGAIPNMRTGLSMSYSYTDADKWKGDGSLGPRNNVNIMLKQPVGDKSSVKVFFNRNDLSQDLYRSLTYSQTQNPDANYSKDYNSRLTGVKTDDINYYRYNSGDYVNTDVLSVISVPFSDTVNLSVKPYYSKEDTEILGGSTSQGGLIQKRLRNIERYGLISQIDSQFECFSASVGYAFEINKMSILTQNYDPLTFAYKGYGIYTENDGDGIVHSPFLKLAGNIDKFNWQTGLKYFSYKDPATMGSVSSAPTYNLVRAADLDREAKNYDKLLPSVGLGYNMTDALNIYTSYGLNFIRPYSYVPIINLYNANRSTFQKAGVTLNELFKGYDMEITDNAEFGLRYRTEHFEVMPAVFYAKHDNLLTTVYDPRVNLSYQQNIGKATGYGLDLEMNFFVSKDLTMFFNPTYTHLTYDENLTYQGKIINAEGNQVVDTPDWMVKTGLIYTYGSFEIVPMLKYMGERYGDVEHKEKIDDFIVADLNLTYRQKMKSFGDTLKVSLQFQNLLNKKYVSNVNASDDSQSGSTGYYVGAPFTMLMAVSFEY
ncbi:MAG: TonB-dependent receptor [Desulfobacteraceae bacterium IS3]|nr:MAG: TonB-dependent receptor [Desulfobacteraceae bacterium IS3]